MTKVAHWRDACFAYLVMAQLPSLHWKTTACKPFLAMFTTSLNAVSLFMVPGAPAPLTKICISGDNLLLLYGDDRARLWDVKTLEFWRSMDLVKAKELLGQGGWTELFVAICAVSPTHSYFREQVTSRFACTGNRCNHAAGLFS